MASAAFKKGDFVIFNGYGDDVLSDPNFEPLLEKGQRVRIEKVNDDGGMAVLAVDDDGSEIKDGDGKTVGDTLFPEEVTAEAKPVETETAEQPAEAAKPAAKGKAKAAAAPKQTAEEKAAAKAAEKAAAEKAKADAKAADKAAKDKAKADAKAAKEAEKAAKGEAKLAVTSPDNDDPLMIRVEQTPSVSELLKEQSALDAAEMLVNRSEQTDFTLGGVLHHIYITGAFKSIGYDGKRGFADYADKKLGIGYRKARYLITIYTKFAQVFRAKGITEEDLLKLGWSKAKELARIPVDKLVEDYDALIDMANDPAKSRDDLVTHIKEHYEVVQRAETVRAVTFTFKVVADAADTVKRALDHAKTLAGEGADDSKALEYMAGDWLNTAQGTGLTLEQVIDLAAANFGVTLIVAPAEADEGEAGDASGEEAAQQAA